MRLRSRFCSAAVSLLLSLPGLASAKPGDKADAAPVAAVGLLQGAASYQAKGKGAWIALRADQPIYATDIVKTEKGAKVVIAFSDGSKIQIGEKANFAVESLEPKTMSFRMAIGILDAWVAKLRGRRFQVRTPTAVASVRGTQLEVAVDASGKTEVFCFSGSVDVAPPSGNAAAIALSAGQSVTAPKDGPISAPAPVPAGTSAPPEPEVTAPEPGPAPAPAPTEGEKAPAADETKTEETETAPPPPPNPSQDQQVVSPSTP